MNTVTTHLAMLAATQPAMADDGGRPILSSACLFLTEDGHAMAAAATDSYRLAIAAMEAKPMPVADIVSRAQRGIPTVLIPRKIVKDVLAAAKKSDHKRATHVRFTWSSTSGITWELLLGPTHTDALFKVENLERPVEGEYAHVANLIPSTQPTFQSYAPYGFNPEYLAGPMDIAANVMRYMKPRKQGFSKFNNTQVVLHGTADGSNLKPTIATMHFAMDTLDIKRDESWPEATCSVIYLVMGIRLDENHSYPNGRHPGDVVVDKWVADNHAQYDYTVDTPCKPNRSAYTVDPEGDAAFALAWRKWVNHCEWVADDVVPCENDPRHTWWVEHVGIDDDQDAPTEVASGIVK